MTDLQSGASRAHWHSGIGGFVVSEWPYLLMLLLALFGVAYTSFTPTSIYWVILAPFIGLVCVVSRWREARAADQHAYLVLSQVLHWGAVLLCMQLMSLQVTRQLGGLAAALGVLTLLALGTFSAGLHIRAWKISVVGVILGLSVPAIAFLQQTSLLILLVLGLAVAIVIPFFWAKRRPKEVTPSAYQPPAYQPPADRSAAYPPAGATERPVPQPPLYETAVAAPMPIPQPPSPPPAAAEPVSPPPDTTPPEGEPRPDNVRNISGAR
uniref:Uncharacterized protein n=1 Tax=Rhodopseudomonas palustris (strain DX-1) TaxID=652103 RepID=E6VGS9_RHOPX